MSQGSSPCFQRGFTGDLQGHQPRAVLCPAGDGFMGTVCCFAELTDRGLCEGEKQTYTGSKKVETNSWALAAAEGGRGGRQLAPRCPSLSKRLLRGGATSRTSVSSLRFSYSSPGIQYFLLHCLLVSNSHGDSFVRRETIEKKKDLNST